MVVRPRTMTTSPAVKAGVSGRAGLKRNCRTINHSGFKDRPWLRNDGGPAGVRRQESSGTFVVTQMSIIRQIHILQKRISPSFTRVKAIENELAAGAGPTFRPLKNSEIGVAQQIKLTCGYGENFHLNVTSRHNDDILQSKQIRLRHSFMIRAHR